MTLYAQLRQRLQKRFGIRMSRFVEDLADQSVFHDLSGIHNAYAVCHIGDNAQVVGDIDHRHMVFLLQFLDKLQDLRLHRYIQSGRRFIADEDLGPAGNRCSDDNALAHSSGKLAGILPIADFRVGNADLF